jgi:hypothetical protein
MKKTVPLKKIMLNLSTGIVAALFILSAFSSAEEIEKPLAPSKPSKPDRSYTIVINKLFENKNYNIEMCTNSSLHQLLITVGPHQKKSYHFYLFDIDGKLKAQAYIRSNEKAAFVNIAKGNYFFEIFSEDERIENGQLTVK